MAIGQHDPGAMTVLVFCIIIAVGAFAFVRCHENAKAAYWRDRMSPNPIQIPTYRPHILPHDMPPRPPPTYTQNPGGAPSEHQATSLHPAQDADSEKPALKVFEF